MGFFDSTPPKRVTPTELHNHVMGQLKTGDHKLSDAQSDRLRGVLEGHMDSDSFKHRNAPGLTADELPGLMGSLKADQHRDHGNHLSDHQLEKVEGLLQKYIDKHVSY
jgi:hypothetical protein